MDYKPGREPFIFLVGARHPLQPIGQCLGAAFPEDEQTLPESIEALLDDLGEAEREPGSAPAPPASGSGDRATIPPPPRPPPASR